MTFYFWSAFHVPLMKSFNPGGIHATSHLASQPLEYFEKRDGEYRPFPEFIHSVLREALRQKGIDHLFSHQAEAVIAVREGKDLVSSLHGLRKDPLYNIPVLNAKLSQPHSKALYLFPTKALSQDQMFELQNLIDRVAKPVATFTV